MRLAAITCLFCVSWASMASGEGGAIDALVPAASSSYIDRVAVVTSSALSTIQICGETYVSYRVNILPKSPAWANPIAQTTVYLPVNSTELHLGDRLAVSAHVQYLCNTDYDQLTMAAE